jgi:predicted deacylase
MTLFIAITLLSCAAFASDLTVGTAAARSGQKANGVIRVAAGSDAAAEIPVTVIAGAKAGPTLALVSGAHGTEYASILAMHKLVQAVDAASLSGAVIVLPLLNVAAFSKMVPHLNPVDGKNLNRLYPGKADGTQSDRISLAITKQVLEKCDYLIDYHGGDLDENLRRYAYWADTGNERLDATTRGMVLAFGLDHIIIQRARTAPAPGAPVTVTRQAQMMGKPAIAVEAGHAGTTEAEDLDVLARGTLNVMRHLKMLPGDPPSPAPAVWMANPTVVTSDYDGVFYPLVAPEAYVQKGQRVGYVTDYYGGKLADFLSPTSGVVIYVRAVPSLKKGDNVVDIGEISDSTAK